MPQEGTRVLIVADDPLARAGLAALLSGVPGCAVVGQTVGQGDLAAEVEVYRPDALLWDLGWDTLGSLERLAEARDLDVPAVALAHDDGQAAQAQSAGARGVLRRSADGPAIAAALAAVRQGLVVMDEAFVAAHPPRDALPASSVDALTPRERDVLRLMAEGLPNKAIASRLGVTDHTVKFHVNAILGKLGAQSRTEAVMKATRLGLVPL